MQAFAVRFVPFMQLYRSRYKTAHRALQWLFMRFSLFCRPRYQTGTNGYNTACDTLKRLPAPERPTPIPRYHRRAGTLYRSAQPPYYNKVYKGARVRPLLWIHARQCSTSQTMPARRGLDASHARRLAIWHRVSPAPSTRRGSPAAGVRRAARNHWRLSPHLFSGFRPIANKDKQ